MLRLACMRVKINQGKQFRPGLRYSFYEGPTQVCLHHTGGRRGHEQVYGTLLKRLLSIHFVVDMDGSVWQHAPLDEGVRAAGGANFSAIQIEVVSQGWTQRMSRRLGKPVLASGYWKHHTAEVHGKVRETWISWSDAQRASVAMLVEDLCDELGIPKKVPRDAEGNIVSTVFPDAWAVGVRRPPDAVKHKVIRKGALCVNPDGFRGVIGHFHLSYKKLDPSPYEFGLVAKAIGA